MSSGTSLDRLEGKQLGEVTGDNLDYEKIANSVINAVKPGERNAFGRTRLGQTFQNARNIPKVAAYSIRLIGKQFDGGGGEDFHVYDVDLSRANSVYYAADDHGVRRSGANADNWIGRSIIVQFGEKLRGLHYLAFNQHHDIDDRPYQGEVWGLEAGRGNLVIGLGSDGPQFNILAARYVTPDSIHDSPAYGNGRVHLLHY